MRESDPGLGCELMSPFYGGVWELPDGAKYEVRVAGSSASSTYNFNDLFEAVSRVRGLAALGRVG